MTVKDQLIRARKRIEDPDHWCKGDLMRALANGSYAYCASGALFIQPGVDPYPALKLLARGVKHGFVAKYNDNPRTTHAGVLRLYDKAIKACEDGER